MMLRPCKETLPVQRVKLFKGIESELSGLEKEINDWLEQSEARVVQIFGNIAPQTITEGKKTARTFDASDLFLAVLYEAG